MNSIELIDRGESETTEFKTSFAEWRDVVETISAFSNRSGGSIFIGVSDDCDIVGVDCGKSTIENLANQIKQNTDPVIYPSIRIEVIEGKRSIDTTYCGNCGYDTMTQYQNPVIPTNISDATTNLCKSVKSVSFYFSDTDLHGFYLEALSKK